VAVDVVASPDLPKHQAELLDVHSLVVREAMLIVTPAMQRSQESPGNFALCAIFNRLLRMARAVEMMGRLGYADGSQPVARSMVNAAVDIIFIAARDTNERALTYAFYSRERRRRRARSLVDHGFITKEQAEAWDAQEVQKEEESLARHAASGITPMDKLGDRKTSWHGQSDEFLIRQVGRGDWYDLYYVPFSDTAHANVVGSLKEMQELAAGKINIGPRFDDLPLYVVVLASADTLTQALDHLNRFFALGPEEAVGTLRGRMLDALREYSAKMNVKLPSVLEP
jgi:hypothetical protein